MQPVKIAIPGQFWDSQIYRGKLYLFERTGQRHASNVPPDTLLRTWCEANLLRWAVMSKIMKGKPCNL